MNILYLFLAFTAGLLVIPFWQIFVRGRIVNWFYTACVIAGALADVGCQLWIDIHSIGKRRKKAGMDDTESFYHK